MITSGAEKKIPVHQGNQACLDLVALAHRDLVAQSHRGMVVLNQSQYYSR